MGITDYAGAAGWTLTMAMWSTAPSDLIASWDPDGILGTLAENSRIEDAIWRRCPIPIVGIKRTMQQRMGAPCVLLDHTASGRAAARHFLDQGFQHLAYCWMGHDPNLDEQMAGFRAMTEAGGRTFHCLDWTARPSRYSTWSSGHFRAWLASELVKLPKPAALMVDSDWTGLEAIEACRQASLTIPEQIALIGYSNHEAICRSAPVPLSSVDPDLHSQGREAAALLDRLMNGDPPPDGPLLVPPKEVTVRQSSDVLAVPHSEVAKALRFIKENYANPQLSVPEIVAATTMSKSGLNYAFLAHLGHAIGDRLRQVRMEKAQELLLNSNLPILSVASACGYGNVKRLRDNIARTTGLSPRQWRKKMGRGGAGLAAGR